MSKSGLLPEEEEILSINATCTRYNSKGEEPYIPISGELVLVHDGVVFLEATGMLKQKRERTIVFGFGDVLSAREESKGISVGGLMGKINLILEVDFGGDSLSKSDRWTLVFTCSKEDSQNFLQQLNSFRKIVEAYDLFDKRLLKLIKPREEISLLEVSKDNALCEAAATSSIRVKMLNSKRA